MSGKSVIKEKVKSCRYVLGALFSLFFFSSVLTAQTGAKYLIISHDNFIQAVLPLVEWKTKKGIPVVCVPLSQTGNTPTQIKSFIQNAYNNWNPRPEYILLVGCPDLLPSNSYSDDYYADMTGDYRIELCIGRFHCQTIAQCSVMVAKTIGYEKANARSDTNWFCKGTTIVGEDQPPDPYYQPDCRYIRNLWLAAGYIHVDSFIDTRNHNQDSVINAINDGRAFVVYRDASVGWWSYPFDVDPNFTNNGYKLPIIVSGSCATMTLYPGEEMIADQFLRAGTVQNPKGSVGFFATTDAASHVSNFRSAVTRGFFQALYQDSIFTMGGAAKRGKFILDSLYHNHTRYEEWNLLGDPELNVWTSRPKELTVIHDTTIFLNQPTNFQVWVGSTDTPIQNALVCVMMDSTVYDYAYTDNSGSVTFSIIPQNLGRLEITATAHNYFPYEGCASVLVGNAPHLLYHHNTFFDPPPTGNGDSIINPGEMINLFVYLLNSGVQPACSVTARLSTTSQYITIIDSISSLGNILPESIVGAINPFRFSVVASCTNRQIIDFALQFKDTSSYVWFDHFSIMVAAGKLILQGYRIDDSIPLGNGNGYLGPGENVKLYLSLNNPGLGNFNDVSARLRTSNPYLVITDSLSDFGRINASTIRTNDFDPFTFSVAPELPCGQSSRFTVFVFGQGGTYLYAETLNFQLIADPGRGSDPTGPDQYGYYCYDDTDTSSSRAPAFNWFEIAPPGPGSLLPRISNGNDFLDTMLLPFSFNYYGQLWGWTTICSNGFLTMGRTSYRSGNNLPIPDSSGPMALIAPFWDDLNTWEGHGGYGDIYQYYDTSNHRLILEFKDIAHNGQDSVRETFQAILFDPAYYPSPTGDGDIIFQYQLVSDPTSNTVGIESYTKRDGILYLYNNIRLFTAAPLIAGRVLRFTTFAPAVRVPWLYPLCMTISDSIAGNNNRIPEPGEGIELMITLFNQGIMPAENVQGLLRNLDGNAVMIDSLVNFDTIPPQGQANNSSHPYSLEINHSISDTILDFYLTLSANNYNTTHYFSINVHGLPGISETYEKYRLNPIRLECSPNPFSSQTLIRWNVPSESPSIKLKIYDASGRLVINYRSLNKSNCLVWNGKNDYGRRLGSGIYFMILSYQMEVGEKNLVRKIIISR